MSTVIRTATGFAAILAILALTGPAYGQESGSVRLRLRLEPGMSYRMSTSTEMDATQTVMGQAQRTHQLMETFSRSDVLSVDGDGIASVRMTREAMRLVQEGPMGSTRYDSAEPAGEVPREARPYALMLGESFIMRFARDGSVVGVEGMDDLLPRMIEEMDIPPGPMRDQIAASIGDQFGDDAMADMMRKGMTMFPSAPVAVGDSWTTSTSVEKPMPMEMETTWTLRERHDGVAYVDMERVTTVNGTTEIGPIVMTQNLSGRATGSVEIEEATGLVLRSRIEDESSGTITMGGPTGDRSIPMTVKSVNTTEILSRN